MNSSPEEHRWGESSVEVRRFIAASPEALFAAWTEPAQLLRWWGPSGVTLVAAEIDLRVGGRYRLANRYQDGSVLWIAGTFEEIDRPNRLVYSWAHEPVDATTEQTRVTVRFDGRPQGCEVVVHHEGFRSARSQKSHADGWLQCLERLQRSTASGGA
jgi:uncharacterized protein YndB with AHSA1/START domain